MVTPKAFACGPRHLIVLSIFDWADGDNFHVEQFAMHMAGVAKMQFEPLSMAIASMLGYTVLFAGVTVWRLSRKG